MLYWNITVLEFDISIVYFQIRYAVLKCNGKAQCSIFLLITAIGSQCHNSDWKGPWEVSNLLFKQCSLSGCSQGFLQRFCENLWAWRCHNHPVQLMALLDCPCSESVFFYIHVETLLLALAPVVHGRRVTGLVQSNWLHCALPLDTGGLLLSVPWSHFFNRLKKPQSCYLYSQGKCSRLWLSWCSFAELPAAPQSSMCY